MKRGNAIWAGATHASRIAYGLCIFLFTVARAVHAQEPLPVGTSSAFEAFGGNSALQLRYLGPSPLADMPSDLDYGFLISEDRDIIASAALMFHTNVHVVPNLTLGVGPQVYLALLNAQQKTDVTAIAAGANARYEIFRRWGFAAFGSAFYSPGVLTFGNAHNLYDFVAGAEIRGTSRLTVLVGYRWLKFTTVGEPDVRVQNEVFIGLRWRPH